MTDNNKLIGPVTDSRASLMNFNSAVHDIIEALVLRVESQGATIAQLTQRLDGIETSDVATRSQAIQGVDNFEELQAKVDRMERNFANEMLDVIRDNGTVREELQQLAAEEARDVLNDSDIEADSISGLADFVEEAVGNMDLSDVIDPGDIEPSKMNMKEFAWYLLDEPLVRNRFQDIDEGHSTDIERLKEVQSNIVRALGDFSFNILPINLIPKDERDNKVKEVADNAE